MKGETWLPALRAAEGLWHSSSPCSLTSLTCKVTRWGSDTLKVTFNFLQDLKQRHQHFQQGEIPHASFCLSRHRTGRALKPADGIAVKLHLLLAPLGHPPTASVRNPLPGLEFSSPALPAWEPWEIQERAFTPADRTGASLLCLQPFIHHY